MSESNGGGTFGPPPDSTAATDNLGLFARTPLSPPPTQAPVGTDEHFGNPAPAPQFDGQPPASGQYGGPPPIYAPSPYPPGKRSGLPVWAIVAICIPAGLVMLAILAAIAIPVFLNQRHTPVAPATLGGLAKSTDPQMTTAVTTIRNEIANRNQAVKSAVAGYGALRTGYVLMSFGARVDVDGEFRDLGATTPPVTIGDEKCASNAVKHLTMCLRGGVEVAAFGPVDLTKLAAVTDEAWKAQPFG